MRVPSEFTLSELADGGRFFEGRLPAQVVGDGEYFQRLWNLQPAERPWIIIHGRRVQLPRNQQAFGADYAFSGQVSRALPVPPILMPYVEWARDRIDDRLNGLLLNWYDGAREDYIGAHHDKTKGLVTDTPIVTISCGASRNFRLSQGKGIDRQIRDFVAAPGTVFVMPWETNKRWKHEVPHFARDAGRRISITLRAFVSSVVSD